MNTPLAPVSVLLLQWTLLLVAGWSVHALLRNRDPRWRLILWRSILCFSVVIALVGVLPVPRLTVTLPNIVATDHRSIETHSTESQVVSASSTRVSNSAVMPAPSASAMTPVMVAASGGAGRRVSWRQILLAVWLAGACWEAIRLLRIQLRLRQISGQALAASSSVQTLAVQIQGELNIRRNVRVRVSDSVSAPFLCGVFKPVIIMPRHLAEDLPLAQLNALLSHEMAHEWRRDLAWCIAWRLIRAVCWFHPLVWRAPDAHVLACEEEADRIAASRRYEGEYYARLLAQLALRVVGVPRGEQPLTLSATSHIARRLVRLGRERATAWRTRHTLGGIAGAAGLLVLTAGWQFAQPTNAPIAPAVVPTATVVVTVQDEAGNPIVGATVTPDGLRGKGDAQRGSHFMWRPAVHGPAMKAVTDEGGHALVTFPLEVLPEEKIQTGEISFSVDHPEFSPARTTTFLVDGTAKPIRLKRGILIRVAGYFGANHERVTEIIPTLIGDEPRVSWDVWLHGTDGGLSWGRMSAGKHFLQISGRLASGEMVYSDGVVFYGEQRDSHDYTLELKPGVRVEGSLDAKVPRPVKNGWIQLSVHSDGANIDDHTPRLFAVRSGNTGFWFTYRPIAADGTFVFESVPNGDLIKVIAYGDGFISANGVEVPPQPPRAGAPVVPTTRGIPQTFNLTEPVTKVEVATERTATMMIVVKADGNAVKEAKVSISPNVAQLPLGSRLFAAGYPSNETPFRTLPPLPEPNYSAITNDAGVAVLQNVPAFVSSFIVQHDHFEAPLQPIKESSMPARFRGPPNRYLEVALAPGQSTRVEVALQPKGREFVGSAP